MSNLIATGQIGLGDVIKIDLSVSGDKLTFSKERAMPSFAVSESGNIAEFPTRRLSQVGAKVLPLETEAAGCERPKNRLTDQSTARTAPRSAR